MSLPRIQSSTLWLCFLVLYDYESKDLAGAEKRVSVVGEIYALVPGESERTLLDGLLHAWLTYVHGVYIYIVEFAVLYHRSASFCVLCRPYSCFITGVVALLFYAGCRGLDALPDNTAHAANAHHVRLSEYHFLILPWHNFFWSSKGTLLFILPYMAESLEHCTRCMSRCWLGAVLRILFFRGY